MIGDWCSCCGREPVGDRDGVWCARCSDTRHDCPNHRYVAPGQWPDQQPLTHAEVIARRSAGVQP